jgi:hypothetical protein
MTEGKVNETVKSWLEAHDYHYKGICRNGQVPVPIEGVRILIDHQGEKLTPAERLWVEAKGEVKMSEVLEGFVRLCFAVFYGGGDGLLAVPQRQFRHLLEIQEFLGQMAMVFRSRGKIGLFNAEGGDIIEL